MANCKQPPGLLQQNGQSLLSFAQDEVVDSLIIMVSKTESSRIHTSLSARSLQRHRMHTHRFVRQVMYLVFENLGRSIVLVLEIASWWMVTVAHYEHVVRLEARALHL